MHANRYSFQEGTRIITKHHVALTNCMSIAVCLSPVKTHKTKSKIKKKGELLSCSQFIQFSHTTSHHKVCCEMTVSCLSYCLDCDEPNPQRTFPKWMTRYPSLPATILSAANSH